MCPMHTSKHLQLNDFCCIELRTGSWFIQSNFLHAMVEETDSREGSILRNPFSKSPPEGGRVKLMLKTPGQVYSLKLTVH